jgi:hypothetical protein
MRMTHDTCTPHSQNQSTQANRKSLIEEHQKAKTTAREVARLEKQKKLADNLREKIDASENGVDLERKKNWEWSIEQNQTWAQREADKVARGTREFDGELRSGLMYPVQSSILTRYIVYLSQTETQKPKRRTTKTRSSSSPTWLHTTVRKRLLSALLRGRSCPSTPRRSRLVIQARCLLVLPELLVLWRTCTEMRTR